MTYRINAPKPEDGPEPLPKGPAQKCRGCGKMHVITYTQDGLVERSRRFALQSPKACTPEHRVKIGFFPWSVCDKEGEHLHEECTACGLRWLTGFNS